jgi:regulatory protein YycH of two-component signal transduction system YycFG
VLLAVLSVSLAYGIWGGQADFRSFSELYVFAVLVAIEVRQRRHLWVIAAPVALAWLPVVVHQVAFI